jgi:hypothetical protein
MRRDVLIFTHNLARVVQHSTHQHRLVNVGQAIAVSLVQGQAGKRGKPDRQNQDLVKIQKISLFFRASSL